jgi:two-component system sensor histidine kinase DegS
VAIEPLPAPIVDLAERARREVEQLSEEIGEIELLVQQARTEATRHEQKRAQAIDKARALPGYAATPEIAEQQDQLLAMTRRSAIMEAQVDILEGKLKILTRFKESLRAYSAELDQASVGGAAIPQQGLEKLDADTPLPPAVSRLVLAAQEDLRRDIARAMHDGPAQSLTNIVLQAQIVERLLQRDPGAARKEIGELIGMVQHTLEATKTFIFDVRPMVLDDLGLVPTLRRVSRDRGRRAAVPIEFESYGTDRRLPMDVESAIFRVVDETITGFLSCQPSLISIRIDWSDGVEAHILARRNEDESAAAEAAEAAEKGGRGGGGELPAALKAMIDEQRAEAEAARASSVLALPAATWREVEQRAKTIGATATLVDEGREVVLVISGV